MIRRIRLAVLAVALSFTGAGCSLLAHDLPVDAPALADMEEPLELRVEPQDESARAALPLGSFTGIYAADRAASLDAMLEAGDGVRVARVVENSPADAAGILEDDVVLEARVGDEVHALRWPSDWRALEIATPAGATIALVVDRAGVEHALQLVTSARVRPPERAAVERFREEARVGVVLRTATEVEARAAGLGPGAGAVVVGLSRRSPWRSAGIVWGDLVVGVNGAPVGHPSVVIDALRTAPDEGAVTLDVVHAGVTRSVAAPVARRASELREFSVPFLFEYTYDRGRAETSVLFGIFSRTTTPVAWRTRFLWFIVLEGGEADRLEEQGS